MVAVLAFGGVSGSAAADSDSGDYSVSAGVDGIEAVAALSCCTVLAAKTAEPGRHAEQQ